MSLETHKMLALSTAHLSLGTRQDMDRLEGSAFEALPVYYSKGDYGWFVAITDDPKEDWEAMYPEDLRLCIVFARSQGCSWIMFDRDVEPIDELHNYED